MPSCSFLTHNAFPAPSAWTLCQSVHPPALLQSGDGSDIPRQTRPSDPGKCGTGAVERDDARLMPDGVAAAGTSCDSCAEGSGLLRCLCQFGSAGVPAFCPALASQHGCCCPVGAVWPDSQPSASFGHDDRARRNMPLLRFAWLPWRHRGYPVLAAKRLGIAAFAQIQRGAAALTGRRQGRPGESSPR